MARPVDNVTARTHPQQRARRDMNGIQHVPHRKVSHEVRRYEFRMQFMLVHALNLPRHQLYRPTRPSRLRQMVTASESDASPASSVGTADAAGSASTPGPQDQDGTDPETSEGQNGAPFPPRTEDADGSSSGGQQRAADAQDEPRDDNAGKKQPAQAG